MMKTLLFKTRKDNFFLLFEQITSFRNVGSFFSHLIDCKKCLFHNQKFSTIHFSTYYCRKNLPSFPWNCTFSYYIYNIHIYEFFRMEFSISSINVVACVLLQLLLLLIAIQRWDSKRQKIRARIIATKLENKNNIVF